MLERISSIVSAVVLLAANALSNRSKHWRSDVQQTCNRMNHCEIETIFTSKKFTHLIIFRSEMSLRDLCLLLHFP